MLGRLEFARGGWGKGEIADLYGLRVLHARADPEGLLGRQRVRRAGRALRRGGVVRALLPRQFGDWALLEELGLRPVLPDRFLKAHAPVLTVEALRRGDVDPRRATVALSGPRTDGELARAALALCPEVRRLVIAAPDGEKLARRLREEFGVPVLPPEVPAQLDLRFRPGGAERGERRLELYGRTPDLAGLTLSAPALAGEEREDLSLLSLLWEWRKLDTEGLKFT